MGFEDVAPESPPVAPAPQPTQRVKVARYLPDGTVEHVLA